MFFYRDDTICAKNKPALLEEKCPVCGGNLKYDWLMPIRYSVAALARMLLLTMCLAVILALGLNWFEPLNRFLEGLEYLPREGTVIAILMALCLPAAYLFENLELKVACFCQLDKLLHGVVCKHCGNGFAGLVGWEESDLPDTEFFVLSGFSGVGKGTICTELEKTGVDGRDVAVIRSVTCREPRGSHEDYTFVKAEKFQEMVETEKFLEHTERYGTPLVEIRCAVESGKIPLLEINYQGLQQLRADTRITQKNLRTVFLAAPAREVARRLCLRNTETDQQIRKRLEMAIEESRHLDLYDAIVINREVPQAVLETEMALAGEWGGESFDDEAFRREMTEILADWPRFRRELEK